MEAESVQKGLAASRGLALSACRKAIQVKTSRPGVEVRDAPGHPELADGQNHWSDEPESFFKEGVGQRPHVIVIAQAGVVGSVQTEGRQQAMLDAVDVEQIAPILGPGGDGGDEARRPRTGVKRAGVGRAFGVARQQRLVEFGVVVQRQGEMIVTGDDGLHCGALGTGGVGVEGVIAQQFADPLGQTDEARADDQRGEKAVERRQVVDGPRRRRPGQPVRKPGFRHRGRPFARRALRRSRFWPAAAHAATAIVRFTSFISAFILALASFSRAAFSDRALARVQFQGRSS